MSIIELVEDDTGPPVSLYVTNSVTGEVNDLTLMVSAQLHYRAVNTVLLITSVPLTVLGAPTLGVLLLMPTALMTATPGNFEGEVEILMPSSVTITSNIFQFRVRAQIG